MASLAYTLVGVGQVQYTYRVSVLSLCWITKYMHDVCAIQEFVDIS